MDKLPYLTQQIRSIGTDEIASQLDTSSEGAAMPDNERKVKELEEYPRPLAVVGVSVL